MSSIPSITAGQTAWLTTEQMREVDRLMIEEYGIVLLQMMENAGRSLSRLLLTTTEAERVTVLAGTGGNGGGGLVAARHLANAGITVSVVLTAEPDRLTPVPRHQYDALVAMGVAIGSTPPSDPEAIIDAMIGYGLTGPPRPGVAQMIDNANQAGVPVVALDAPSGLDTATGRASGPVIEATATLTLALPKVGLRRHRAVGALYLADISVPSGVYQQMGISPVPSFRDGPILAVGDADAGPGGSAEQG